MIDAARMRNNVVSFLSANGFENRDADASDFQRGDDSRLRFKVGTSRGEVAIQVMVDNKPLITPIRILADHGFESAKALMAKFIDGTHDVVPFTDETPDGRRAELITRTCACNPATGAICRAHASTCTCGHPGVGCVC